MVPSSDSGRHSMLLACAPPQMPFKRGVKTEIMCLSHKQQAGNQLAAGMMKAVPGMMAGGRRTCSTTAMSMTRFLTAPATRPTTDDADAEEPTSTSTCGEHSLVIQGLVL